MLYAWEPVRLGLITSLARPEGNVTGVAWFYLIPKQMELLKEIVPNLKRVAYVRGVAGVAGVPMFSEARKIGDEDRQLAASALGFTWQVFDAATASDYDEIFARIARNILMPLMSQDSRSTSKTERASVSSRCIIGSQP